MTPELVEDLQESLEKYKYQKEWLSNKKADYETGKDTIKKNRELGEKINSLQKMIEKEWDLDFLATTYEDYSQRYRSMYTVEFKSNYKNYIADMKLLKLHHKDFQKKLTYDTAVDILKQLTDYKAKEYWFQSESSEFEEKFTFLYKGKNTSWKVLHRALEKVSSIKQLLSSEIPPTMICLLEIDHSVALSELHKHIKNLMELFDTIKIKLSDNDFISYKEEDSVGDKKSSITHSLSICEEITDKLDELRPYYKNSRVVLSDILTCFDTLVQFFQNNKQLVEKDNEIEEFLGESYQRENTNWEELILLLELSIDLRKSPLFAVVFPILESETDRQKEIMDIIRQMQHDFSLSNQEQKWLFSNFSEEYGLNTLSFPKLSGKLKDCFENIDYLLPWIDYEEAKSQCISLKLGEFITIVEEKETFQHIDKVFLREFYTRWLDIVGSQFDFVRKFRRNNQDSNVDKFVELDQQQRTIAQSRIREKLIGCLPTEQQKLSKANDELSILRRELEKKKKHMPLRSLFKSIPNLILRLKPCLMMSPLFVSTILEADSYEFDLLIFDEASQIFPEDAIGSLCRAKQVIVAGDSKQLPPSNFFSSNGSGSSNDDYDTENENNDFMADSVLEEAVKILHNRTLRWHYRSKYESLITFSNREIYKNKLITFPSKEMLEQDVGLEFVYVKDGYYESGTAKSFNMKEAEKCAELVHKHILSYPNRTLGIIAFSKKQQEAIESKINQFREKNPQFEYFFDENNHEPFFVKNLENVQGDERDTILFSVGYAKEQGKDKMAMRFGPLSQSGGERRLNVAITRAKYNMKLIASILPSDFNITENSPEGTKLLRSFIEFARLQSGQEAPITTKERDNNDESDDFVQRIATFLTSRGYVTKEYVGTSDYKIDIAVENPHRQGEFSVAIECDGICYFEAKTASDRDHLRGSMLDAMGWKKYRVWSTEWVRNTEKEEISLVNFIEQAYSEEVCEPLEHLEIDKSIPLLTMTDFLEESEQVIEEIDEKNPFGFAFYESFSGFEATDLCDLYDHNKIGANLMKILSVESPLPLDLLYRKVLPTLKSEKLTTSVKKTLNLVRTNVIQDKILVDEDDFVWILPKTEPEVRIPKSVPSERTMDQISTLEVAKALLVVAEYLYGPSISDLMAEVGQVYGFGRTSKKIKEKVEAALKLLLDENKLKILDDKVIGNK